MKYIITIALAFTVLASNAQTASQKHLPAKVVIILTDRQVLKLDSALNIVSGQIDSKSMTKYLQDAITPLYQQIGQQMGVDSIKVKPTVKKP